jgi:cobalt-zinc-cadmium efflux system outer membrane protein
MRSSLLGLFFAFVASAGQAQQPAPPAVAPLTFHEALRQAEAASTLLRTKQGQLAIAEGLRRESAALLFNNPELTAEQTRRRAAAGSAGESAREPRFGVSQPFETGGQQGRRREVASATRDAIDAEIADARIQVRSEAALRFSAVLAAQRRVQIEERSLALFDTSAQAVARRREAGEDTRLDANVAAIEAERARNALVLAREQLINARAELAALLQSPLTQLPEVVGDLAAAIPHPYTPEELERSAQNLPRIRALVARESAARARLGLEQANRSPDVRLGLNVGREGPPAARERVTTVSVTVPLPIFRRNDAAIGQAQAEATQAEVERLAGTRDAEAQVRRLWLRLASQIERAQRLQRAMLPAAQDNQQLAARSRQAGQIGLLDQLVVNRQALDAEREVNDALADLQVTRIELERAAGWPHQGTLP